MTEVNIGVPEAQRNENLTATGLPGGSENGGSSPQSEVLSEQQLPYHFALLDFSTVAAAPQWALDLTAKPKLAPRAAPADVVLDTPAALDQGQALIERWLRTGDVPAAGKRNGHAFRCFAELKDLALSPEVARALYEQLYATGTGGDPPDAESDFDDVIGRLWSGKAGDNPIGSKLLPTASQVFAAAAGIPTGAPPETYLERLQRIRDVARKSGDRPRYTPPPAPPLFMTAAQLDASAFPVEEDIWQGLVLRQLVNLLYGDGEAGKTMLACHLAVARAAGLPDLFGHKIKPGPVLMVLCEDAYHRVRFALRAICTSLGVDLAGLPITFCCQPADPILAMIDDKGVPQFGPFLDTICERLAILDEPLVVLDTVSDIAELNENLRLPPNTLLKKILQPICDVFGATILVTAHPSAAQANSGRLTSGSTAWRNGVRNALGLTGQKEQVRHLYNLKDTYGSKSDLYLSLSGPVFAVSAAPAEADGKGAMNLRMTMRTYGMTGWANALTDEEFAERRAGDQPVVDPALSDAENAERYSRWATDVDAMRQDLRDGARAHGPKRPARYAGLFQAGLKKDEARGRTSRRELKIVKSGDRKAPPTVRLWFVPDAE